MPKLNSDEKRWQAESDARTLLEAQRIDSSKPRKSAAIREVKKLNKVTEKELKESKKLVASKGKAKPKAKPKARAKKK